jgi:hypothetical protein
MRRGFIRITLAGLASFLVLGLAAADDEKDLDTSKLAPEALLCLKLARKEVIKGSAVDDYIELLQDGDVAAWNKKRKKDGGKVLDLAARTWDAKGRDDLVLKLEGLDLHEADLSNVIFMPGTSFAFSDLSGANFRSSCLEGVKFASIWSFDERTEKQVRSTTLANADLRDVVWSWCSALDRTVKRTAPERRRSESVEARRRKNEAEQQRLMEQLRHLQTQMDLRGTASPSDVFAFCDVEGMEIDKDAPVKPSADDDEEEADPQQGQLRSRTVEKLVRAARAGTLDKAVDKLATRRHTARTRECANPLKAEPALAAAIAAASSSLVGIEKWKAVTLVEVGGRGEEATIVGGENVVLVIDNPRIVAGSPLLVTRGPIFAWRNGVLPLTFSASVVVLKDQAYAQSVVHGEPVFALSERLRGEKRQVVEGSGTYHSIVVADVAGVENLSEVEAERRALQDAKLKDYAAAQGDLWENARILDPKKELDGVEPEKGLPEDVRTAILSELGKDALDGMQCYKLSGQVANQYQAVISNDPKAILVIAASFQAHGSIYSEGPVVFLEGKQKVWVQRCVTKSWLAMKGEARVGQLTMLGKRIDVEAKKEKEDE